MSDGLQKYWAKRDFGITGEPKGAVVRSGQLLSFVVQRHAARRLHYDFRLELGGTLKSWAIPKGPSLDPTDKRMAVETEDHPLEYAQFEGTIPPGQYGAGTVIIWDRGHWQPVGDPEQGYRDGKLKFELHGEKLSGTWNLVRMRSKPGERQQAWLLIKERDEHARPAAEYDITEALPDSVNQTSSGRNTGRTSAAARDRASSRTASRAKSPTTSPSIGNTTKSSTRAAPSKSPISAESTETWEPQWPAQAKRSKLPLTLTPQLATLVDRAPASGEWLYEIKFDGYRVVARIDAGEVRLFTRNGHDWTRKMPHIAAAIATLPLTSGWLDGEIVMVSERGRTDFQSLQNAFDTARTHDIQFYAFDLPYAEGRDLTAVGARARRALLRGLFEHNRSAVLKFSESFEASAEELLHAVCRLQLEGLIGKRADAPYVSARSPTWIKLKCTQRQEFVIGGFTDPRGARSGFGSLLLGVHDPQGRLIYAGNVGTGFNEATLADLKQRLDAVRTDKPPFFDLPRGIKGHWVRPKLVAEVSFGEWTQDGRVRHAVFHGLRSDKPPGRIVREQPQPAATGKPPTLRVAKGTKAAKQTKATKATKTAKIETAGVAISNPGRVIDESTGLTKLDLVRYYEAVAEHMLPHLKGRPTSLVRGPQGIGGQLFFQKHTDTLRIPGVIELDPAFLPGHPPMIEIASASALVQSAQMNAIEFHTWNATVKSIEHPDRMLFDLDPGEGVSWQQVVEGTLLVKALLDELKLRSFLKTSGGKGLHVVVPLAAVAPWDRVKDFSEAIVLHLAKLAPQRFVAKSGPKNRIGRIFPDYLRNARGATTAAAFSARARPGLGVSVPLTWDEIGDLERSDQWTIANVGKRLARLKNDPWAGYNRLRQTIDRAEKILKPR